MTDTQKLQTIDAIVDAAYALALDATENRGAYFEGVISAIFAVLMMEGADNNADI